MQATLSVNQTKELKNAQICSRHFREEDFEDGIKAKILGCLPKILKLIAIPSVDLPGGKLITSTRLLQ